MLTSKSKHQPGLLSLFRMVRDSIRDQIDKAFLFLLVSSITVLRLQGVDIDVSLDTIRLLHSSRSLG